MLLEVQNLRRIRGYAHCMIAAEDCRTGRHIRHPSEVALSRRLELSEEAGGTARPLEEVHRLVCGWLDMLEGGELVSYIFFESAAFGEDGVGETNSGLLEAGFLN